MFLAGIHLLSNNGCPIKAFGHDLFLSLLEKKDHFFCVPNTIGFYYHAFDINSFLQRDDYYALLLSFQPIIPD